MGIPKIDDVVMVVENSNPKNTKEFKLGIIRGIKRSRNASSNIATVHLKLVEGLAQRKQALEHHNCVICGPKSLCNLVTSSRNLCLLERHEKRDFIDKLADGTELNEKGKNSTVIMLANELFRTSISGPGKNDYENLQKNVIRNASYAF